MKMSKKMLSIILALVIAITCVIPVFADTYATSGTFGENVTWEFDITTRTLTISGTGNMYSLWYDEVCPWYTYKDIIKSIVIKSGITDISSYAFRDHSSLKEISIPDTVNSIGSDAFEECISLQSITLPSLGWIDTSAFSNCYSLKEISFRGYVGRIGWLAFSGCSSLENVYVDDIEDWLMMSFESPQSNPLYYAKNLYVNGELVDELILNGSVLDYAFYSCDCLKSITISEYVNSISDTAFMECNSLTEISVDNNNTSYNSIEGVLFSNNLIALILYPAQKSMDTYTIPDNVLIIKDYAFANNAHLKNVICPISVASIGEYNFNDTIDLYYEGTEEQWKEISVQGNSYFERIHFNCTNPDGHYTLTKVVNPSTCRDEGYSEYTCPCGYTMQKDYTYLDHTPGDWNISQYPTCTNSGYKYQRCTVCGDWLAEEEIPATGHTAGEWQSIAPTCTKAGLEGKCCTECGELLEGEIIAALGGSHTFGEWEKVDNRQARTCATCGYIEYKVFPGDLNGDGYTSAIDARIILQIVAGLRECDSKTSSLADINGDGRVSAVDARIILQIVTGLKQDEGYNIIDSEGEMAKETNVSVKAGDEITVTVNLAEKSGIGALTLKINYDSTAFKPIEVKSGDFGATVNVTTGMASMANATTFEEAGRVYSLTLVAIKDADSTISVNVIETCDADYNDVDNISNELSLNVYKNEVDVPSIPDVPCGNGHNYISTVTAPTCTEQGYTTYTCTNCADMYKDDYTSATGHNYTWYTISVVTCETDGVMLNVLFVVQQM